ncbi:uncharacterized protein LOC125859047 [Solanum stenotomum]|uniref:uncharacterized protein LOC125859047 n=1 Tax=Solanum stenotomum TaxID=172797 RepID=UPI0020D0B2BB|nr:uncharacterized protein LOC125859047 [Solanum stenotomum]
MTPYEALYGRKCRSPIGWFEVGEIALFGPDLVLQAMEKFKVIQQRLATAQRRHKSYANVRRRGLEFSIGDWVFLKVSNERELPQELSTVHSVFHVSMLRKCVGDPSCITPIEDVQGTCDLTYEEVPITILDRQVKKIRNKEMASVKVQELVDLSSRRTGHPGAIGELQVDSGLFKSIACILVLYSS